MFYVYFSEYGDCIKDIATLFHKLIKEYKNFEDYARQAEEIEHQGDKITRKIIDRLNRSIITPLDREDIHLIARKTDMIIDLTENVISNICLYKLDNKVSGVNEFGEIIYRDSRYVSELLGQMKIQKYTPKIKEMVKKIHRLEDVGDELFEKSMLKLFNDVKDPILIIKWKDILEDLELITDKCKNISNIIEGVMIKSS